MSALASRVAAAQLSDAEREALDLRETGAGYTDIALELGIERSDVAPLLAGARLRVRDAVRGAPLAEPASDSCARARPLLCARQDRERLSAEDREFLSAHVDGCEN